MPLRGEYLAAGHTVTSRRGIVVRVTAGDVSGWGEFVEIPGYSAETVETALASMEGSPLTHVNPAAVQTRFRSFRTA